MTSKPPPGYGDDRRLRQGTAPVTPDADSPGDGGAWSSLEPLSRHLLTLAALLGVLLIAAVGDWLLQSKGNPFNPIAAAAVRTQKAAGARFSLDVTYASAALPQPVVAHGSGAYNARTRRSRATLEVPSAAGTEEIETVADQRSTYTRSDAISAGLPPSRPWLGVQPWLGRSESAALVGSESPASQLQMLQAVGSKVESLGEETVRGNLTHRYRGEVELTGYAQLLRKRGKRGSAREFEHMARLMPEPIKVEVWIDDGGMARQLREVMALPTESGHPPVTTDLRIELFGFGAHPEVSLPKPAEVFDSTPLVRAELDLLDGESADRLINPTGKQLSDSAYRRNGNAICSGIERKLRGLSQRTTGERRAFKSFALTGGPRSHSSQETLRAFRAITYAYYEPALAIVERGMSRLGRLSPPASRDAAFRRFMRQTAQYAEIDLAETRAAEVGRLDLAQSLSNRLRSLADSIANATRAAGLADVCAVHDEPESTSPSGSSA